MSVWRDIWRDCVKANRIMAEDEEDGLIEFHNLFEKYNIIDKETGEVKEDGMIHYVIGESYEYRKKYTEAVKEYEMAQRLFPVDHWKNVAGRTIERVKLHKTAEAYFDENYFDDLLWMAFQKVYEFVNLNDFVRYVSLSAISRGSSEWPLSLVDFRTVLELQLKVCFPEVIEYVKDNYPFYSVYYVLKEFKKTKDLPKDVWEAMDQIREAGNIAAHDAKTYEADKFINVKAFITILEYFNSLPKNDYFV